MDDIDRLRTILQDNSASVTTARIEVFQTLQAAHEPLKTGEIARRTPSVNRASVYRILEFFSQLGITTTIIRGWTPHIELAEPFKQHHHHITCTQCGTSVSIEHDALEDELQNIARHHQFTLSAHIVELSGICRECRQNARTL